ncbi:Nif3-like dinuclear metal center hexameric protein [uncultured Paraglaciecola sp.]|jgi:dinuclear metal center YbgI/SA1388 family protein|uniref:Nif3-like dinuclear metal center hexameric protein n=1 Tax=uncultured Paraglaciecola sp. TaxID=1765024 RepID=UPI0026008ED9|nr:Nif3-like dinuclear metal center hexameric protein [uncultured Paraglaciecola sp.]
MSVSNTQLLQLLNSILLPEKVNDYCPNGLQVEGKKEVTKIVTGVTASQALIDHAVSINADAILVHHGYFWKGESPCITGMKKKRIQELLKHDINLYAYHLPLDIHPTLGNNAQLAKLLGIVNVSPLEENNPQSVVMQGRFDGGISPIELSELLSTVLNRTSLLEPANKTKIETVAWCTGGGQGYIELAAEKGIDAYITGEVSEQTIHVAREMNIHFYAAGHHATERYGVKALGDYVQQELAIEVVFVDIDNPA